MKIVLATGIYPPDIGGPATYVENLAKELSKRGEVTVVAYGLGSGAGLGSDQWKIFWVSKSGGPIMRWWRYAQVLKQHASDTDVVIAFSSVSVGMPLWISGLKKPKRMLRLGGDFFWERYTDRGGMMGLREWYENKRLAACGWRLAKFFMQKLLRQFDHIIFSTEFQEKIYEKHYKDLPSHSVIENASPTPDPSPEGGGVRSIRTAHTPFRILFMGRFVGFKNLSSLVHAVAESHGSPLRKGDITLTMVGDGSLRQELEAISGQRPDLVRLLPPVHGMEKQRLFAEHDLLILPSLTEISPHVALEARAAGLPVLLSSETGLSEHLRTGMVLASLRSPAEIQTAIADVMMRYPEIAKKAGEAARERSWQTVMEEYLMLFCSLV